MQTTKVVFEGVHDGQRARVRFETLDNSRNSVSVTVGSRVRAFVTPRTVKPCLANADLLVSMVGGEGRAKVAGTERRGAGRRR